MTRASFILLFLFSFLFNNNIFAQEFISPINAKLIISGAFGEPRENHFHTGVDFTTRKKTGIAIYAAADGYVSRIKVSPYGYGRAIYIIHPNGLMTVYGHLSHFNDAIQKYVTEQQYKQEKYEQELYPNKDQFPVKQGEVIAYSGNSGSSTAPHLHFEIRDAAGESFPLNPLAYKLPLRDTIPPIIKKLAVYNMDVCCGQLFPKEYSLTKAGNIFKIHSPKQSDTLEIGSAKFGLGVKAFDLMNGADADGDFGVYSLEVKLDNKTIYDFSMDRIDFSETNYANAEIDYALKTTQHEEIYRCYLLPGNKASIYKNVIERGIIQLTDNSVHKIEIIASDYFKNKSTLLFYAVERKEPPVKIKPISNRYFVWNQQNTITTDSMKIIFPAGTFFDDIYFVLDTFRVTPRAALSTEYKLQSVFTPIHQSFELYIKPNKKIEEKYRSKTMIVSSKGGGMSGYTSSWEDGFVKAKPGNLGEFFIAVDTVAPLIKPKNFKPSTLLRNRTLIFEYSDNISGMKDYKVYIDDKWILTENDPKSGLVCKLGKNIPAGEHTVKVAVTDNVNNKKTYKYKIRL